VPEAGDEFPPDGVVVLKDLARGLEASLVYDEAQKIESAPGTYLVPLRIHQPARQRARGEVRSRLVVYVVWSGVCNGLASCNAK
jgi:hypothetical protein